MAERGKTVRPNAINNHREAHYAGQPSDSPVVFIGRQSSVDTRSFSLRCRNCGRGAAFRGFCSIYPGIGSAPWHYRGGQSNTSRIQIPAMVGHWAGQSRNRRLCTGVLIAPNKALTAAHCLWNSRARRWLPANALHFVAGWRGGAYTEHARGVNIKIRPGLSFSGRGKPNHLSDDWAIIELDRPIGNKVGFVPLASQGESFATKEKRGQPILYTAAYSTDKPHILQSDSNCRPHIATSKGPLLMHDCDLTFGTSGAPILIRDSDGYRVVAVQVAVVRNAWQERGVAVIPRFDRVLAAR